MTAACGWRVRALFETGREVARRAGAMSAPLIRQFIEQKA